MPIEPRLKDPSSARCPDIVTNRESQTVDIPVSVEDRVRGCVAVDRLSEELGTDPIPGVVEALLDPSDQSLVMIGFGQRALTSVPRVIVRSAVIEMGAVVLRSDQLTQGAYRGTGVAHES